MFLQNAVIELGESWPDWRIVFELGRRLGLTAEPWHTAEAAIDYQLEPAGVTVAQTWVPERQGLRLEEIRYEKYRDQPLRTPSGKVEFFSERLAAAGFSGVPCGRPGTEPDQLQRPGGRVPARRHQRQPRHPLHQLPSSTRSRF